MYGCKLFKYIIYCINVSVHFSLDSDALTESHGLFFWSVSNYLGNLL